MDSENAQSSDDRRICPYHEKCYRKNPIHFHEMAHPHLEKLLDGRLMDVLTTLPAVDFECSDKIHLLEQLKILQMVLRKQKGITAALGSASKTPESPQPPTPKRLPDNALTPGSSKKSKDEVQPMPTKESTSSSREPSSIFEKYDACKSQKAREELRNRALAKMRESGQPLPHLVPLGEFDFKYAMASPYYVFLTCVQKVKETFNQPYTVTFPELLDISLGEIEESLHLNYMVDVGWVCLQYLFAGQKPNCLILLGDRCDDSPLPSSIKTAKINMPTPFGTHHSKISVLKYTTGGVRIIISTANLYNDDWENRTQALWMSYCLPKLPDDADKSQGESKTGFKKDFLAYLNFYRQPSLEPWIRTFETIDFSSIEVFFVASVPGNHKGPDRENWALGKLRNVLSSHAELPADGSKWPVVAQASSIGSLGPNLGAWLTQDFLPAMSSDKTRGIKSQPNFQFIYPSINNYKNSFDAQVGSCCLPYSMKTHQKQPWLVNHLYQWKSNAKFRDRAMPHSKFYTRLSPDLKKIPWAVITSGNLSKAAWGYGKSSTTILNYEAGVVFLPQFLIGDKTFPISDGDPEGIPPFPITYDLPLTPYGPSDEAFVMEFFQR